MKEIKHGLQVKKLLSIIAKNNETHGNDEFLVKVTYEGVTIDEIRDLDNIKAKISNLEKYIIELKYNQDTKRVNEAIIK